MANLRASRTGGADVVDAGAEPRSLWHPMRVYPGFRVLLEGTLATNSAFWMWQIANGWLALELTNSPLIVGLVGFLGGIPMLVLSLPAGVIIDRVDRRTILLGAQVIVTVVSVAIATLLLFDLLQIWHLLVGTFVAGSAMSFVFPTRNTLVANLVPTRDLASAIALNSAGQNAPRVVGPALAGPLIALVGTTGTYGICAALQVLAFVISLRLPSVKAAPRAERQTVRASLMEGIDAIVRNEFILALMILAAVPTMLVMPYANLLPVFARDELGIGSSGLGLLMAVNGVGAVLGSLAVGMSQRVTARPSVMLWMAALFAGSVIAFALSPWVILSGVLVFIAGIAQAFYMALNNTQIQLNVEDSVRGRVLSVYMLTWGLLPFGVLPIGALADAFGAPVAVAGASALALVGVLVTALKFPSLRAAAPAVEPEVGVTVQR